MTVRLASTVYDALGARLSSLERTRAKMEQLHSEGRVARRDVEHAYGGIFLTAFSSLESLIEDLFLKLLVARVRPPANVNPRVFFKSDVVARQIVFAGRHYVDWIPYHRTTDRANLFFSGGRPFEALGDPEREVLESASIIRNAIAHQSRHARRTFDDRVVARYVLAPRERTPTGFLRSLYSAAPNVTRYEQLASEMSLIARKLVT